MSYSVTTPNEQIVLLTFIDRLPTTEELMQSDQEVHKILSTFDTSKPVFLITDMSSFDIHFSDLMKTLNEARQFNDAWYENLTMLIVGQGDMAQLTTDAFQQEQFGSHPAQFFTSVDAALQHALEAVGIESK